MKPAAACFLIALASAGAPAMSRAAGDPIDRSRACSSLTERKKCVDSLSRETASESAALQTARSFVGTTTPDSWIVSETTSPVDYSPVVIATATANDAGDGSGMKLLIACRGGNTSLAITAPGGVLPAGGGYTASYAIDGGPPTSVAATATPSGTSMDLHADVVRLLASLPAQGEVAFRIAARYGESLEGRYSLAKLKATRDRMAISCKWPAKPDVTRK